MEHHGGLREASRSDCDVHTEDPVRLSGICRAFTMACICHGAKGIAIASPHPSHFNVEEFLLTGVYWFLRFPLSQVFRRLLAAELPPNEVWHNPGAADVKGWLLLFALRKKVRRMGKSPFYQFLSSFSVYLFRQCCY